MVSKISALGNYGGAEIFEIFFSQTLTKFSASANCVGAENLNNATPTNKWKTKLLIMLCRQYDDSVECYD